MKIALAIILQFLIFLIVFAGGSFMHPFNFHWAETVAGGTTHFFIPDGLLLAVGILLAILLVQFLRKRTCDSPWTILAFVLAVGIGYAMKFGFITKDVF